jgi:hypothetical protein
MRAVIQGPGRMSETAFDDGASREFSLAKARHPEAAARALAAFLVEAEGILERLRSARGELEAEGTRARARLEALRALARTDDWTEFDELPVRWPGGRNAGRSLLYGLADQGLVDVERNATYPNMVSVRMTPAGSEALHREAVREAMAFLRGPSPTAVGTIEGATEALRRLAAVL